MQEKEDLAEAREDLKAETDRIKSLQESRERRARKRERERKDITVKAEREREEAEKAYPADEFATFDREWKQKEAERKEEWTTDDAARVEREAREDQQWEKSTAKLTKQLEDIKMGLALQKGGPRGEKYRLRAEEKLAEADNLLKAANTLLKQREDDLRITESNAKKAKDTPEEGTLKS